MDFLAELRRIRAHLASARATPENTPPGRITAEAAPDGAMQVRVIGTISWWAGNDVIPTAERLMDERPAKVRLYVDSPGGDLFDAMALRSALDSCGAAITATGGALVGSAAVPVFLAGAVRTAQPYSRFMIHQPRAGFMAFGTAAEISAALAKFVPTLEAAIGLYRDSLVTRVGAERADEWMSAQTDTWLTAAEAAEAGILTEAPVDDAPVAYLRTLAQGLADLYGSPHGRH